MEPELGPSRRTSYHCDHCGPELGGQIGLQEEKKSDFTFLGIPSLGHSYLSVVSSCVNCVLYFLYSVFSVFQELPIRLE